MARKLMEDGTFADVVPGMRWRRPQAQPVGSMMTGFAEAPAEVASEEPTTPNPAPPPAVPLPDQARARVHSRSPFGAVYLPGEGPPADG